MKLVILITSKTDKGFQVAESWQEGGAPGVTIIHSHGLHSVQKRVRSGSYELPRMLVSMSEAMAHVLTDMEATTLVFISVMPAELVESIVKRTEVILGDLLAPDTGVFFVLDVEQAIGVRQHG